MADPETFDIEPGGEANPGQDTTLPTEVQGKTVTEIWRMVEAERARGAEIDKARQRAEQFAQEIAMAALDRRPNTPSLAPAAAPEPDRDENPDAWIRRQHRSNPPPGASFPGRAG